MKIDPIYGSYVKEMRTILKDFCSSEFHNTGKIYNEIVKLETVLDGGLVKETGPTSIHAELENFRSSFNKLTKGANQKPGRESSIGDMAGSLFESLVSRCLNECGYGHEREPNGPNRFPDYKMILGNQEMWFDCKCVKLDGPAKTNKNVYTYQLKNAATNEEELCNGLNTKENVRASLAILPFYNYDTLDIVSVKIVPMMYLYQVSNKNPTGKYRFGIKSRGKDNGVKDAKVLLYLTTFVTENKPILSYADQKSHVLEAVDFYLKNH